MDNPLEPSPRENKKVSIGEKNGLLIRGIQHGLDQIFSLAVISSHCKRDDVTEKSFHFHS